VRPAASQTTAEKPTFEVASVKPNINGTAYDFQVLPGGRFVATNHTVSCHGSIESRLGVMAKTLW
jgi:hypothetical protein